MSDSNNEKRDPRIPTEDELEGCLHSMPPEEFDKYRHIADIIANFPKQAKVLVPIVSTPQSMPMRTNLVKNENRTITCTPNILVEEEKGKYTPAMTVSQNMSQREPISVCDVPGSRRHKSFCDAFHTDTKTHLINTITQLVLDVRQDNDSIDKFNTEEDMNVFMSLLRQSVEDRLLSKGTLLKFTTIHDMANRLFDELSSTDKQEICNFITDDPLSGFILSQFDTRLQLGRYIAYYYTFNADETYARNIINSVLSFKQHLRDTNKIDELSVKIQHVGGADFRNRFINMLRK